MENPIINPCGCKDPIQTVHLKCLIKKIDQNLVNKKMSNFLESFVYTHAKCDKCQYIYPEYIRKNGVLHTIFNF